MIEYLKSVYVALSFIAGDIVDRLLMRKKGSKRVFFNIGGLGIENCKSFDTENVGELIRSIIPQWNPNYNRIYHGQPCQENDITPTNETDVKRMQSLDGDFYVVAYPGDPITTLYIVVALVSVYFYLTMPDAPNVAQRNTNDQSPNNSLTGIKNAVRIGARTPDIFGTVRSIPDVLSVPLITYDAHRQVEHGFLFISEGTLDIDGDNFKLGNTKVSDIADSVVNIFGPNTSPNSGDSPQLKIPLGESINKELDIVREIRAVNGQILRPINENSISGEGYPESPNKLHRASGSTLPDFDDYFSVGSSLEIEHTDYGFDGFGIDFPGPEVDEDISVRFTSSGVIEFETDNTDDFEVDDAVKITGAQFSYTGGSIDLDDVYVIESKTSTSIKLADPEDTNSDWDDIAGNFAGNKTGYDTCNLHVNGVFVAINFDGVYEITSITEDEIELDTPKAVNSNWNYLHGIPEEDIRYDLISLSEPVERWVGPFTLKHSKISTNFIARNGLYKDDGVNQYKFDVQVQVEIKSIDNPTLVENFYDIIEGSRVSKRPRALTMEIEPDGFSGPCEIRARRVTPTDTSFEGVVYDDIQWVNLYTLESFPDDDFGDCTTAQYKRVQVDISNTTESNEFNVVTTRKIPTRISGDEFTTALSATNDAAEIFSSVSLDPYIGAREKSELDFDNIYDAVQAVKDYFGTDLAGEFNYTFDKESLSYEDTVAMIAQPIGCNVYRQGDKIKMFFERQEENSTLLFNHRNKLPGSEKRSTSFGDSKQYNGVELEYVDPDDDTVKIITVPLGTSPTKPRKIKTAGVRSYASAYFHAWRAWNKIQYQNEVTEFEATQEAALLLLNQRIEVADNTRPGVQDGEVRSQDGLTLTLSQNVTFDIGEDYIIFLQHTDGTVEQIAITAGSSSDQVVLANAPKAALSLDADNFAICTYKITKVSDKNEGGFLVTERAFQDTMVSSVTAINYTDRYYLNDGLEIWLPFGDSDYTDRGYGDNTVTAGSGASIVSDSERGDVHNGSNYTQSELTIDKTVAGLNYTFCCWAKRDSVGDSVSQGLFLIEDDFGSNDQYLSFSDSAEEIEYYADSSKKISSAFPSDEWHHVAIVHDGSNLSLELFVDGASVGTASLTNTLTGKDIVLAKGGGNTLLGRIDNLRYYSRALSLEELAIIYNDED